MESDRAGEHHPKVRVLLTQTPERVQHLDGRLLAVRPADVIDHVGDLVPQKDRSDILLFRERSRIAAVNNAFQGRAAARPLELPKFVILVNLRAAFAARFHRPRYFWTCSYTATANSSAEWNFSRSSKIGNQPGAASCAIFRNTLVFPIRRSAFMRTHSRSSSLPELGNEPITPINVSRINDAARIGLHVGFLVGLRKLTEKLYVSFDVRQIRRTSGSTYCACWPICREPRNASEKKRSQTCNGAVGES